MPQHFTRTSEWPKIGFYFLRASNPFPYTVSPHNYANFVYIFFATKRITIRGPLYTSIKINDRSASIHQSNCSEKLKVIISRVSGAKTASQYLAWRPFDATWSLAISGRERECEWACSLYTDSRFSFLIKSSSTRSTRTQTHQHQPDGFVYNEWPAINYSSPRHSVAG